MIKSNFNARLIAVSAAALAFGTFAFAKPSQDNLTTQVPSYVITSTDKPVGLGNVTQQTGEAVTVRTKSELWEALGKGGLIYVDGMIDLSEGYMPTTAGGSSEKLDALVAELSEGEFANYEEYKIAYTSNCSVDTDDKKRDSCTSKYGTLMWKLNDAYKAIIRPQLVSNTTIIGISEGSGITGGTFIISKAENVVIRNLIIKDAYDPFPHHEKNDGFNSQHDTMCIQDGSHDIWIDHCTFYDTLGITKVTIADGTEEKYQTYDGLLDMKSKGTTNITVSYCKFMNHDKTMLIGSSDTELKDGNRDVTLHHNLFINCGQRLPMVRQTNLHAFNNVYLGDNSVYASQYAIGVRNQAVILSENNYFGTGVLYSYSGTEDTKKQGCVYSKGDVDYSANGRKAGNFTTSDEAPFVPSYTYKLDKANKVLDLVKKSAGAGKVTLK